MKLKDYLREVGERARKATDGPWTQDRQYVVGEIPMGRPGGEVIICCQPTITRPPGYPREDRIKNAEFVTHSRTDIPKLILLLRAAMDTIDFTGDQEIWDHFNATVADILEGKDG